MWDVVKELGFVGIPIVALVYLAQKLLSQWMDKSLEAHKTALRAESDLAIERLRSELRQQSLEHEVKYRRNDDRIADVLEDVYKRLLRFYECTVSYVKVVEYSSESSKESKLEETQRASKEFWDCFIPGRLYIPPTLFKETKGFADNLVNITNEFTWNLKHEKEGKDVDHHFWSKAYSEINEEQSRVFSSLIAEFQRRLGVFDFN